MPEKEVLRRVETEPEVRGVALVVLGRGVHIEVSDGSLKDDPDGQRALIERVRSGATYLIKPTDILEEAVPKDYSQGVTGGPEQHPVFGWKVELGKEPEYSRYAGGILNVLAAARVADKVVNEVGQSLVSIYWAAGRTPEMEKYTPSGWNQGMVMAKYFLQIANEQVINSGVEMAFEPENQDTQDDVAASLLDVSKQGYDQVIVLTVGLQMARTYAITQEVLNSMEKPVENVTFVASESALRADGDWWPKIREAAKSRGHEGTLTREQKGRRRMKSEGYVARINPNTIDNFAKSVVNMTIEEVRNFR